MTPRALSVLMIALALLVMGTARGADNSLTITETSGLATSDHPVQIGRPFVLGEIQGDPQALLDGVPVPTQADVKSRWADGSVKHAILSFVIPVLPADATVTVTFQDIPVAPPGGGLTQADMLGVAYDFDAVMELTDPQAPATPAASSSARDVLAAGNYSSWLDGPVATSIILADHSLARVFDIGLDANRSFRPIVHATFWPSSQRVRVRFIGEIANTEVLQDQVYSLALKTGLAAPATVLQTSTLTHLAASRWTQEAWIGTPPTEVAIDHNLAYLTETLAVFNHDVSKSIPESRLASVYASWQSKPQGLYDAGNLQKSMGSAGGRPEIGPYPGWHVLWLYTGDRRMREVALGNTDLAAAWPVHLREGDPSKFLDRFGQVPGLGRVMSVSTRPTMSLGNGYGYSFTVPNDRIVPVGPTTDGGWKPDNAHQPELWSVPYLLTGDFWYLEQGWFWAAWSVARLNGAAYNLSYGRGPTGAEGGTQGELRGQAWTLRNRANMHFVSPDAAPEKALLQNWMDDAIAIQEGAFNITGTQFEGSRTWDWGRTNKSTNSMETLNGAYPPLNQFRKGSTSLAQAGYGIDDAVTKEAESNFEQHFMLLALGRATELGHASNALLARFAQHYVGVLTNPDYNPYLLANGRVPTVRLSDGQFIDTWAGLKQGYQVAWQTATSYPLGDAVHGYAFLGLAGVSMIRGEPGGQAAWDFVEQEILSAPILDSNPKWALVPRAGLPEWTDLGGGTTGINGQPTLTVAGPLSAGSSLSIDLIHAPSNALMLFRASLSSSPVSAVGGTIFAIPFDLQLLLGADASGEFSLTTTVAPGAPAGQAIYFQFLVQDLSVPYKLTLSNATTATTP
jgi:hypothetical protein